MKRILNKLIIVTGAVFMLAGCEGFLQQEPVLQQTSELTLSTFEGLNNATVGAYTPLYGANWYGGYFVLSSDMRGGNGKLKPNDAGYQFDAYTWNYTAENTENLWSSAYTAIARANNVINAIPNYVGSDDEKATLQKYKAECLFIRAIAHFDLVRLYAQPYSYSKTGLGVPVVIETKIDEPARNTIEEVYAQVVADLKEAESLFGTYKRDGGSDPKGFATKEAAQALLARVYLYMEDWQNAATYATKVIDSEKFEMWTADQYVTVSENAEGAWGRETEGSEVIFSVYGALGNSGYPGQVGLPYMTNPEYHGDACASDDLLNLYEEGDVRRDLFYADPQGRPVYEGYFWTNKYPSKTGDGSTNNTPVLRLSEMYLIRAEAIYKGASISGVTALSDFNMVRTNRGLAARTSAIVLSDISAERRRELCFEGHITFDLARRQEGLVRIDYDATSNQNISFPDNKWAVPIPKSELNANENMVQNP
ncbi:MAG: RagB/SusD family nutrient uptake outer membrane protein [Draconibacterium sp.]